MLPIISLLIFVTFSCDKDTAYPIIHNGTEHIDSSVQSSHLRKQKVKQSYKIHDDNVNGTSLRKINTIHEAVYFFYNEDNLIDSLAVLSDTSANAILLRTMKLHYLPKENKIEASLYDIEQDQFEMTFSFDINNKVIAISNKSYNKEMGVFFIYDGEILSHKKYDFGKVAIATNMKYDKFYNLKEYELYPQTEDFIKVNLEYNLNFSINKDFDIRFNSKEIKFIYEGGLNIIHLMGLNMGLGNTHIINKRIETNLYDNSNIRNQYLYKYQTDMYGRISERKILINEESEVIFEYKY